jgi:hypothetical protein
MRKKRPCSICRKWFLPDKQVGNRQKVCSRPECQKERHRRESIVYRKRERFKDKEMRIVTKLRKDGVAEISEPADGAVLTRLRWSDLRELVPLEQAVIFRLLGEVIELRVPHTANVGVDMVEEDDDVAVGAVPAAADDKMDKIELREDVLEMLGDQAEVHIRKKDAKTTRTASQTVLKAVWEYGKKKVGEELGAVVEDGVKGLLPDRYEGDDSMTTPDTTKPIDPNVETDGYEAQTGGGEVRESNNQAGCRQQ